MLPLPASDHSNRATSGDRQPGAIVVHPAQPSDGLALIDAFEQINRETDFLGAPGEHPPWADAPEAHLRTVGASGDEIYLIATHGDAVVGYLGAARRHFASCRGTIYIFAIGIRAAYRGRGLGAHLLAAIEDCARAQAGWRLELRVVVGNDRALALYRRCGFVIEGRMTGTFRVGDVAHDTYWMAKQLRDDDGARATPFDLALGRTPYPPPTSLRPLHRGDGAALQRFERDLLDGPPLFLKTASEIAPDSAQIDAEIAALLDTRRSCVLVVVDSQQRIVAHGGVWRESATRLRHDAVCQLNVLRPWWGCGIGRQLAERLEDWAASQGLARLTGALQAHNLRGQRFAAARGFRQEVVSPGYARFGDTAVDRILMMRTVG